MKLTEHQDYQQVKDRVESKIKNYCWNQSELQIDHQVIFKCRCKVLVQLMDHITDQVYINNSID